MSEIIFFGASAQQSRTELYARRLTASTEPPRGVSAIR